MLAESCTVSNPRCPLMRSPDGQKYIVWIVRHGFTLIKIQNKKNFVNYLQLKVKSKKKKNTRRRKKKIKKEDKKIEKKEKKIIKLVEMNLLKF